jgi:ferritin-like protein
MEKLLPGDEIPDLAEIIAGCGLEAFHEMVEDASEEFVEDYLYDFVNYTIKKVIMHKEVLEKIAIDSDLEKNKALSVIQNLLKTFATMYNGFEISE